MLQRRSLLVILLFALLLAGGSLYCFSENEPIHLSGGAREGASAAPITVYVCGAVNRPGVIQLGDGARVGDAVRLCGGFLPVADAGKVNMAQALQDGAQVTVPEKNAMSAVPDQGAKAESARGEFSASDPININTADQTELDRLPGIGPVLAGAILEYRNAQGLFRSPEDLMKVKGIGAAKFNKLKGKIVL